jgi:MFS family permease
VGANPEEKLGARQRTLLSVLALPAFGVALAYTVVTTYAPVLLSQLSGPAATGVLIAMEGVLALVVPMVVGGWSDRLRTPVGGRLPFIIAGAVLAGVGLVLLPLLAGSRAGVAGALAVFFLAYFVYYTPYYALFPDLLPEQAHGRSQGFQGTLRSAGMLLAMAGGGVLLSWWTPLPFLLAAATLMVVTVALAGGLRHRLAAATGHTGHTGVAAGRTGFAAEWALVREHRPIRLWAISNACWEAGIGALRRFVVLYFTQGLRLSLRETSGALALVGVSAILAAPLAGKLADRYGPCPVMRVAVWVFAVGLLPPLLSTDTYFVVAIVPIAFAAVVLMTLPYSLLMDLLPRAGGHGVGASLFGFSRGVGLIVGPLLAGIAVELTRAIPALTLRQTSGFSSVFAVTMVLLVLSMPVLRRITLDHSDHCGPSGR